MSLKIPMMLKDILKRIDQRLDALGLTESVASKNAGLSDSAIRNVRRAVKSGKDQGVSTRTLELLAPVLKTSVGWLTTGEGEPIADSLDLLVAQIPSEFADEVEDIREDVKRRSMRLIARARHAD